MNLQNTAPAAFTIAKTVPDQMLVFGWGNVAADAGGAQIEDLQGDIIPTEELEKAAYDHVLRFRSTGEKHDPALRHKGRLVESCVFTREKQAAMGIPPGILPEGWWVGYKIDDPAAWAKIKSGEYQSFSVGGKGVRTPVEKARHPAKRYAELRKAAAEKRPVPLTAKQPRRYNGTVAKTYAQMRKFNPYHDEKGRFASQNAHTGPARSVQLAPEAVTIQSVARVRAFPCETLSPAQQRQLQDAHKRLLVAAAAQPLGVEVGQVLDLHMTPLTKYVAGSAEGHSVQLPDFQVPYIVIHTHPAGGIFSHGDLLSFVECENLKLMTAIGHNGHVFAVEKNSKYNANEANSTIWQLKSEIDRLKNIPRAELSNERLLERAEELVRQAIGELQENGVKFYG